MKKNKAKFEKANKKKRLSELVEQIKRDKVASIVYFTLRFITIGVMIRCIFTGQWESVFTCLLALTLFLLPPFVEKTFKITLPTTLEVIAYSFVFCAEILGEISCYYLKYSFWDTMLHTVNGFIFAAFGFCLLDMFNRSHKVSLELTPISLTLIAFCFSMTIGVLWEFFEFGADIILRTDMQKDFILDKIQTVTIDPTQSNTAILLDDIVKTTIHHADGSTTVIDGGYLDIGIYDTMKDLFVNFIGAVVFSIIGFIYVKQRGKGKIARQFIPVVNEEADTPTSDEPAECAEAEVKESDKKERTNA